MSLEFQIAEHANGIVPHDTRYVPLQQQPYLCCPTAIMMVMLRHEIPLVPAELLGWHMGLTVPAEDAFYFYNPRINNEVVVHGTQIDPAGKKANEAFKELGIPLVLTVNPISDFKNFEAFSEAILMLEKQEKDVLFCTRWGDVLSEKNSIDPIDFEAGHIMVMDRVYGDQVRIIDPARGSKWRIFDLFMLFQSMHRLGAEKAAGLWILEKK